MRTIFRSVLLLPAFAGIFSLEILSVSENNTIFVTETILRNTTNQIFLAFKLRGIKNNVKLKKYSLIHNFFSSLTLKDQQTLDTIEKLSKSYLLERQSNIQDLVDVINDLLNEDSLKSGDDEDSITYNVNVISFVKRYLSKKSFKDDDEGLSEFGRINFEDILNAVRSDIVRTEEMKNQTEEDFVDDDGEVLSDDEFWVPEEDGRRIYRGQNTKAKHFPFMASIQIFHSFQCGAAIIKSDLVITAAACLQLAWNNRFFRENPSFLSVRVGSNFYQGGGEDIDVLEVYFHPDYNPKTLRHNLSIVRLVRRIKFRSRKVKKIDFDRNPTSLPENTAGITIVGWGARTSSNILDSPWSTRLAFSVLDIYPLRECRDIYSKEYVTKRNFCAGFFSKGGGACNKDAGDPGIVNGLLTGVVSFGSPVCGSPDAPTVFTKLGFYTDWIEGIMEQDVQRIIRKTTLRTSTHRSVTQRERTATTFKITPVGGAKMKPVPISEIDALRQLRDEHIINELLSNIFNIKENKTIDLRTEKLNTTKNISPIPASVTEPYRTNNIDFQPVTESIVKYTLLYNETSDNEIEKNLVNIIENIGSSSVEDSDSAQTQEIPIQRDNKAIEDNVTKIDDAVLTLLYLSDNDNDTISDGLDIVNSNVDDGMSIEMEGVEDLSSTENSTESLYDILPKQELYDLLTEAIEEATKNKDEKRLFLFLLLNSST